MLEIITVSVLLAMESSHSDLEPYKNLPQFDWSETGLLQLHREITGPVNTTQVFKQSDNEAKHNWNKLTVLNVHKSPNKAHETNFVILDF